MKKRLGVLVFLLSLTALAWFMREYYPIPNINKFFTSALVVTIIFVVFRILLQEGASKGINDDKTRYTVKKTAVALFWIVTFILVLRVWVPNPQALLVAYGLVGAGIAVALQDIFKNFVGGIIIFIGRVYSVGDRVQVGDSFGDVIDISPMYTTMMEMKEWVDGDQATGRICVLPNGAILSKSIHNYTKDHAFIWDEIKIPISYKSDWKEAKRIILEIVRKETKDHVELAEKDIQRIGKKYYITSRQTKPAIYTVLTDNWISFNVRYVCDARERRNIHNKITQKILQDLEKSKKVKIASATLNIIGFPDIKLKRR